jgi:hypothetical protein
MACMVVTIADSIGPKAFSRAYTGIMYPVGIGDNKFFLERW